MDVAQHLAEQVLDAIAGNTPLAIAGAGTRAVPDSGSKPMPVSGHHGIVDYEPRELYITARAGTPLAAIEAELAGAGQMLAFEPPRFADHSTLGGAIASGLSGPRRPYAGAARDFVLGCRIINGRGEVLHFGGQVMKNVAGYDVSRLMVGAWGTLGVLLEVSLKVLPQPQASLTVVREYPLDQALLRMRELAGKPLPVDASCHLDGKLYLRLSGSEAAVEAARRKLGGDVLQHAAAFWQQLRDRQLPFFAGPQPLWRLSLPPAHPPLNIEGSWLIEWGGAQRWLKTDVDAGQMCLAASQAGGYATRLHGGEMPVFHALPPALLALHRRVKQAFDPHGIFNPGMSF